MSCCQGNCGCGTNCKCGNGCGGCKMYGDVSYTEAAAESLLVGVAPRKIYSDEAAMGGGENGCKCGSNCTCVNCTC
ncbi:metallothionein-like protein, partial [Genlisea aurea]